MNHPHSPTPVTPHRITLTEPVSGNLIGATVLDKTHYPDSGHWYLMQSDHVLLVELDTGGLRFIHAQHNHPKGAASC